MHHATYVFLEVTKYCIEELKMTSILPDKIQTDHLEGRFVQYWWLSKDQYPLIRQVFVINGFRSIVFIFIVISTTFWSICHPAFFRCLSNSETYTELRNTSFIKSTGGAPSDSVSHNRVQVLSIPVLLLACNQDWTGKLQMKLSK